MKVKAALAWKAGETLSNKINLCQAVRETQGKGLMPNGTSPLPLN